MYTALNGQIRTEPELKNIGKYTMYVSARREPTWASALAVARLTEDSQAAGLRAGRTSRTQHNTRNNRELGVP